MARTRPLATAPSLGTVADQVAAFAARAAAALLVSAVLAACSPVGGARTVAPRAAPPAAVLGVGPASAAAAHRHPRMAGSSHPGSGRPAKKPPAGATSAGERAAVAASWVASVRAFYVAGRIGDPSYPRLISSFVPGSPALEQTEAWLTAIVGAGVMAPADYRVGDVHVTWLAGSRATLTGCSFDTGSVYRSSGVAAPSALGGGAGLTASVASLREVDGRWLVWSDQTSAPASSKEEGPCHGY
jgi:hypothetical protein